MKIVSVDQMRAIEAAADAAGHTYAEMMEHAGRAVAEAVTARQSVKGKRVLILVGPGNNGGDGLVAAHYLAQAGAEVACYLTRPRDPQEDANVKRLQDVHVRCIAAGEEQAQRALARLATGADIVVDALLGTGSLPPLKGSVASVLQTVNAAFEHRARQASRTLIALNTPPAPRERPRPFVVAVDGPSGLSFDTGTLDDMALRADLTVTFAYPKAGHFRFPGAAAVGELVVADIGTAPDLAAEVTLEVVTADRVRAWLPLRPPSAHKGTFGRAMIVAGSTNYTGAAYLAGAAAVRAGVGLATVALPAPIHSPVAARLPEATYLLLPHAMGVISEPAAEVLKEALPPYDALLLGPGLGRERETVAFVEKLFASAGRRAVGFQPATASPDARPTLPPLVVDADALNILAGCADWPALLPPGTILTPHAGEMSRLMGSTVEAIEAERVAVARRQAQAWDQVVVLKGAYTVVAAPDGRAAVVPFANPGLATGGTGDVLAGVIVALRAQGVEAFAAAAGGAYLHGLAGEMCCQALGAAGMSAGDVVDALPQAWQRIEG
ncbi:MAG: NAD(P)H-hydrate dehydratase [Anaerolineae bacterium]|nr:NAD(P)H-hydrate dehydratase [Anaerolineae bacterium]